MVDLVNTHFLLSSHTGLRLSNKDSGLSNHTVRLKVNRANSPQPDLRLTNLSVPLKALPLFLPRTAHINLLARPIANLLVQVDPLTPSQESRQPNDRDSTHLKRPWLDPRYLLDLMDKVYTVYHIHLCRIIPLLVLLCP